MDTRRTPVPRLQHFTPPFCPRRTCLDHLGIRPDYHARTHGWYSRRTGRVPRFRCPTCRSTFCRDAFATTYFLKRPELLIPVAAGLVAGAAHRQLARTLGCAPSTVTRLANRIGRHCQLFLHEALECLQEGAFPEALVLDHFETFEFSQDLPFGVATVTGQRSWFVYGIDPAPHRRSGRVTPAQRRRLGRRPHRRSYGGYGGSSERTLERLLRGGRRAIHLVSDDHAAYRRAVADQVTTAEIRHEVHANPKRGPKGSTRSLEAVSRDRAMFANDLLHGLARHSLAAHRRETIAFGRRLNALMLRMYGFVVWRNFVKRRSERRNEDLTPAMAIGLTDRRWTWREVFARRRFPDRYGLDEAERRLYRQGWTTPVLASNALHALRFAY